MSERNEFDSLLAKLPHEGAMLLIDSIVRVESGFVETETRIDAARAALFRFGDGLGSYLGIELIAQSAAFPLMMDDLEKEHKGMIVQVRSFEAMGRASCALPLLRTQCEVELMLDGRVASVRGTVFEKERRLCEAVLTLAVGGDA